MSTIYAPIIDSTVPAFAAKDAYVATLVIYYSDNMAVDLTQDNIKMHVMIKDIDSNYITEYSTENYKNGIAFFEINKLIPGQYYKFQIAYEIGGIVGEYSYVSIGRYLGEAPDVNLSISNYIVSATYDLGTTSNENLYSYKYKAYDNGKLVAETDWRISKNNGIENYEINIVGVNRISIEIQTINNFKTAKWSDEFDSIKEEINEWSALINNFEEGCIETNCSYRKEGKSWIPMVAFNDYTVEQGKTYFYATKSENIFNYNTIVADFEDMFLSDSERQLKIRFNPQVSSFKINTLEGKVETLGSPYPFFFRSGQVKYKEFPINGLISYQMDNEKLFMKQNSDDENTTISDIIAKERQFKLEVLEWLNNGKPKLFRSPTEGNYIVRLMNVSLAPFQGTNRMIHTFSATAYECAAANYQSMEENKVIFKGGN